MSKLSDNTLSIICILIGMTVFSLQDVLIRVLSDEISAFQILFTRSIVGISLIILKNFDEFLLLFRANNLSCFPK